MPTRLARLSLVILCIAGLLATTTGTASASSELDLLEEVGSAFDGMGTTATEFSGATYNGDRHTLFTIDDEVNAYEFALDANGEIDDSVEPRTLFLSLGADDYEGVAWIDGDTYAFLSEGTGEVIIADVPAPDSGQIVVTTAAIERRFPVITGTWGNLGPEGLATDGSSFYVTREKPSTLSKFDWDGNLVSSVSLPELLDATGVAALVDGTFLVVSHESKVLAHYDVDWENDTATQIGSRSVNPFVQLEGVAVMGNTDTHLFGEMKQGGKTYSHLNGEIVFAEYSVSDVNCSGDLTVIDAVIVTRIETGLMEPIPGCGSGDHNGDGRVSIIDAVMIAQCQVGIPNVGCPIVA